MLHGKTVLRPGVRGHTCFTPDLAEDRDGYTIVEITTVGRNRAKTIDVHVALDPTTQTPRVIGLWRR